MGAYSYRTLSNPERSFLARLLSMMVPIDVYELTNPATAAADGLKAATATTVAVQTITSFEAAGVAALAAYPRNVTFTTAGNTPADAPATATITGTDIDGNALTETV